MKSSRKCIPFLAGLLLLLPGSVPASPEDGESDHLDRLMSMSLEELVDVEVSVTTGTLKPLRLAPSVATVITSEEIKKIGARSINEVLETVPGLHVGVSTKNAMSQVYSIRGIHTSINPQVLLLMNGIPISLLLTGTRAFFNMPVANISRLEIIRGPGSAIYGADAFAGTINIITRGSDDTTGTDFGIRAGSFDSYDAFIRQGGEYHGWKIHTSLAYQKSSGDSERIVDSDLQSVLDGVFGTEASNAPGPLETAYETLDMHLGLAKENWTLRLWGEFQDEDNSDGVTNVVSRDTDLDIDQFLAELAYENDSLVDNTILTSRVYFMYYKQDALVQLFPEGAILPIGSDGNIDLNTPVGLTSFPEGVWGRPVQKDRQAGIELTALYNGTSGHRVRTAAGYTYQKEKHEEYKNFGPGILDGSQDGRDGNLIDVTGTEHIYAPDKSRQLQYLSFQDEWSLTPQWDLVAGLRYDHYSDFGDTINPRAALIWQTRPDLTTKILYGRAFRPPSFSELYNQNNPANLGNDALKPETIETTELVADYRPLANFFIKLNLFYYEIDDLISLARQAGQSALVSQNLKEQEGRGFELEASWLPHDGLLLKGNLAYQDSEDKETGDPVPDAPKWQTYLNAHWRFLPELSLDAQYFLIAGRKRAADDSRDDVKDNDLINLTLRHQNPGSPWETALAVRNLFNEDLREPAPPAIPGDYPLERRSIWAELRYSF